MTRNNLQFSDDHDANISSITKPSSPVPVYCSGCLNAFGARFSHNLWGFDASNQCNNSRAMIDWFPSDVIRLVTVINVCFHPTTAAHHPSPSTLHHNWHTSTIPRTGCGGETREKDELIFLKFWVKQYRLHTMCPGCLEPRHSGGWCPPLLVTAATFHGSNQATSHQPPACSQSSCHEYTDCGCHEHSVTGT